MKHFSLHEFTRSDTAQRNAIDNTPPTGAIDNLSALVDNVLDPLREAWGAPIDVTSGYRCPRLNKAVGGSPTSQHMTGQAADITAGSPVDNRRLFQMILDLGLPFDQLIDERGFSWIHVSYRADGHNRRQIFKK